MKSAVIVNPFSGGGRTAKMWRGVRDSLRSRLGTLEEFTTRAPMEATRFAGQVAHSNYDFLIIAGGDGTINEVVNGLFNEDHAPISPNLRVGILSAGRGCDFIRSVNIPADASKALELFFDPKVRDIDIGLCLFKDVFGRDKSRYFVNIACAGVAGNVARQVSHTPRFLPPGLAYFAAVATNFVGYRSQRASVFVDDKEVYQGPILNVFVANGRYSGAGMCWAPHAEVDDGEFDVIVAEPVPKILTLLQQHKIYDGSFLKIPGVHHFKGKKVLVESIQDILLEIDGEQPGLAPALYTVLPKTLCIVVG